MATIQTKIRQAIKARIATCLPAYPKVWAVGEPITLPVTGGRPAPYIEASLTPNRTVRHFIGSDDPHEYPGLLLLTLCWPIASIGSGPGEADPDVIEDVAGKIAEHFPCDLCMTFQSASVRVTSAPSVHGSYRDDAFLRTPIQILYHAFA